MSNIFSVNKLSFSYNSRTVLDNISFEIEKGRFYGIIGPNGSGKSTLLDHITGFTKPESGEVLFKGKRIEKYGRKNLAKEIAAVYQNFYINFAYSVHEIVMMGRYPYIPKFSSPEDKDIELVDKIMKITGIEKFKNRLVTNLSGGERQRVVFARALAQNTDVLILDEATSNLDINHTLKLMGLVKKRVQERAITVISVFQDLNIAAMFCDNMIFMKEGKLIHNGDLDSVLTRENIKDIFDVNAIIERRESSRNIFFEGTGI